MMIFDKFYKICGIRNEGLKRLFSYFYILGLVPMTISFLVILIIFFEFVPELFVLLLSWTVGYWLILFFLFKIFIHPILFIIEGFKNEKK